MLRHKSILLLFLCVAIIPEGVFAWTSNSKSYLCSGSRVSAFGGNVLIFDRQLYQHHLQYATSLTSTLDMKKGKDNMPPQMRGQYKKQKEMQQQREQMIAATKPGPDGMPVFNLFVRTPKANMWYPCGSFKGDDRSRALSKNYADGNFLAGISKKQIDTGIASSLHRDQTKLKDTICRAYPQLTKSRNELQFGYKLAFEGLDQTKADEIKVIEPKESKGLVDNVKNLFG